MVTLDTDRHLGESGVVGANMSRGSAGATMSDVQPAGGTGTGSETGVTTFIPGSPRVGNTGDSQGGEHWATGTGGVTGATGGTGGVTGATGGTGGVTGGTGGTGGVTGGTGGATGGTGGATGGTGGGSGSGG